MLSNKKITPIVTELVIRCRELNISLVFVTQSYFPVPKNIRLNCTQYFIIPYLIIHLILIVKTLSLFTKNVFAKPYSFL